MNKLKGKKPAAKKRVINVQTYLERSGMWKARKALEPISFLKWSAAVHFAMNCEDEKKIDRILEIVRSRGATLERATFQC